MNSKYFNILASVKKAGIDLQKDFFELSFEELETLNEIRKHYKKRFSKRPYCSCGNDQRYLFYAYLQNHVDMEYFKNMPV